MPDLCLGCASEPQAKEKTSQDPSLLYRTPCCSRFICSSCLQSRRRLAEYCLFCMKVIDAVKAPESEPMDDKHAGQFVIDDSDDDDEEQKGKADDLPPYAPPEASSSSQPPPPQHEDKPRESTNLHYIQPHETLQGIAFSYGITPSQLIILNKLPHATLSLQPTLLHTRSFLILPAKVHSRAPDPHDPPDVAYHKSILRRFQMSSKCADSNVAEVYVKAAFDKKKQELEYIRANREARGLPGGETVPEQGGELEDALEAFRLDERWEKDHPQSNSSSSKGKWTGLTGSVLRCKT